MKVLLAPDKFKGSLTAAEVVEHLGAGLAARGVEFRACPLADGGDGSVQSAIHAGFRPVEITAAGPTGVARRSLLAFDGHTGVVEVAGTCGLAALPGGVLAPLTASSRGLGEAVRAALGLGARKVVLALGGSAGTDGGAGLLAALGAVFRDDRGQVVEPSGGTLSRIASIDLTGLPDLSGVELVIASDVESPLTGPNGAAAVYGPQKGATAGDVAVLEAGLRHLVGVLGGAGPVDAARLSGLPGAGAAGGLGFAGLWLGGEVVSGAGFFLDLLDFDTQVRDCGLVITGEGRMDSQTRQGKLPAVVARRARPVPVIAVVGRSDVSRADLDAMGIREVFALTDQALTGPAGPGSPATDPLLSARLLRELGERLPLE